MKEGDYKKWLDRQAKELLERLGYDVSIPIHEQFIEKHKEQLFDPSRPSAPLPTPKTKNPNSPQAIYQREWRSKRNVLK